MEGVYWIDGAVPLAIVLCPRGEGWLREELAAYKQYGVETIVSLLEADEAGWLGLAEEGPLAEALGLRFLSFPIPDVHVPGDLNAFRLFVTNLAERLRKGERIGVHCRGSIGRATVTAACALIHLGWKAAYALAAIQRARGCAVPDTDEQLRWIMNYKPQE